MNENNHLHGTLALVRPDLDFDPAQQQGKVGIITYISENDEVFMKFPGNVEAKYEPYSLMQMKDKNEIFPDLMHNGSTLDLKDYKDLYKISLRLDMGRSTDILDALEIAAKNPAIWQKSLTAVESRMVPSMAQTVGR